ncbi:response regulator transcription factor [Actinophytocola sp.]|uniref:response regulator transcription factor n=1 Tax=Actinophytocola sp. TaxID=1872138 RepID=UPI002D318018|nr:response regulator transcription factor [Actinophytocola sp.]HYQ61816.1 response regulator transcription factor [Actinophytocola sp.]
MNAPAGPGVVIADDARLFRTALAELLAKAGCRILAEVGDPDALLAAVEATGPDLAVVDIRMPPEHRLEGLHAAVRIRRTRPSVGVLLLSQYLEAAHLTELVGHAARGVGYLLKDRVSGGDFLDAVRRVAAGDCAFDPDVVSAMMGGPRRRDLLDGLTGRELEVLALMAQGRSNQAIADALHLTGKTVESHVRSIFQRLDIPTEADHHRRVLAVLAYLRSSR